MKLISRSKSILMLFGSFFESFPTILDSTFFVPSSEKIGWRSFDEEFFAANFLAKNGGIN